MGDVSGQEERGRLKGRAVRTRRGCRVGVCKKRTDKKRRR